MILHDELVHQMGINESQLRELRAISKAATMNLFFKTLLLLAFLSALVVLVLALLFPTFEQSLRPELVAYAGPLSILGFFALVQTARSVFSSWVRFGETRMMIKQQLIAVHNALRALN